MAPHGSAPGRPAAGGPAVAAVVLALTLSACSAAEDGASAGPSSSTASPSTAPSSEAPSSEAPSSQAPPSRTPSPSAPASEAPSETPGQTISPEPSEPPDPVSLPAYFTEERDYVGRGLSLGAVREETADYTSYDATYRSDGLDISGVINVPRGRGPFPSVILAHGYIDPDVYVRGQGMTRERGYLAARGFIAFHVDYRAHGESGGTEQEAERNIRLGYVADVLNAASALRRSEDVPVDDERVALFGRSMGGGVTMRALAAAPGVLDAGVAWAAVSSREDDNFNRFTRDGRPEIVDYVEQEYGLPGTPRGREFWPQVSARPYFDRVTEPVLLVHGSSDDTCPPQWARDSQRALQQAGADSRLEFYPDEHAFGPSFDAAMDRTIAFLDNQLA